jgi:nicotinate phosphoribosyltransferase
MDAKLEVGREKGVGGEQRHMSYRLLPYKHSLALFTDLYQLTMGQVYWAEGMADWEACFHHVFRSNPLGGGYTVACGLEFVADYLTNLRFDDADIAYLATIPGSDGKSLFKPEYLTYLRRFEFKCDVDAVPEGTAVFPHEPLLRVTGRLLQAQLVETAVLTLVNYATAVATEAARICRAAGGAPVYDFSARRAPGVDGSFTATRSAYIGGFEGTSNVWAARHLGIPPGRIKGTMAHSLVMSFDSEIDAFLAYVKAMPNNCVFLVDTYGTADGVRNAIEAGRSLRASGFEMIGIRLDSGDLAQLSKGARRMLDDAGFEKTAILATNDLNEFLIESLRHQDAAIAVWGVGTKLMVPALAGVYKLGAIRRPGSEWEPKIKLSDQPAKVSIPGLLQVRRYRYARRNISDLIYDCRANLTGEEIMIKLADQTKRSKVPPIPGSADLLVPVMRQGNMVATLPSLDEIRRNCATEISHLPDGTKRFDNPDEYRVGLERSLYERREKMILDLRGVGDWGEGGIQ